jgi:hypothetical protein
VNVDQPVIEDWTFGGGTAMMLQINHRESRDVDIFLSDPQQLSFLDPQKRDFEFAVQPAACDADGARSLKFVFDKIGEIDFIAAPALTSAPTITRIVEGESILLETIPEIIAKKIYHRANSIKPRDIFDIAAAGEQHQDLLTRELRRYRAEVKAALITMDRLNPDFVIRAIADLAITDPYKSVAKAAIERSKEILRAV